MSYPAISLATATVGRHRCPQKRLQTARQPPVYPNSSPDHRACNSLTPFRCPHAVHPCPSVDSGLAASFSVLSLTTLAFLPATIVIWFAAVRSLTAARRLSATALPAAAAGLLIAATVGFGFYTLLFAQDAEDRCWAQTRGTDGQSRWESLPDSITPGESSISAGRGGTRAFCSDIITNTEAAISIGVLAVAFLIMLSVARFRRATP